MKPEDILDGLGQINEQMALDAQNLKKSPRRGLKIGSIAACILCGVVLLGLSAAKLWNRQEQQSQNAPEPSLAPAVSELPQEPSADSAEDAPVNSIRDAAASESAVEINDYEVVVREDAVYFVDPYIGLMSMNPETGEVTPVLPDEECSLAESDGQLYCLGLVSRRLELVENGGVTTLVTLEDVGPGYPILLGVSDGYVCWQQDWTIYTASVEDGTARVLLDTNEWIQPCAVYQGGLYGVDSSACTLYRVDLGSGERETLWASEQSGVRESMAAPEAAISVDEGEALLRLDASMTDGTAAIDGEKLYLNAEKTTGDVQQNVCCCYDLTTGEMQEQTTLESGTVTLAAQSGKLYLLHADMQENGETSTQLLCSDGENEAAVVLDTAQTASMGSINSWQIAPEGIYYSRSGEAGLYYRDFSAGTDAMVYQSGGIYGSLIMEPDFYWQQEGTYGAGAWYEHFNERSDAYDLTYTENGIYFVSPAEGVYRYLPEEDRLELLVSGIACRILSCNEGLYATCSDSGEVYRIQDGTAELLLTLEKDPKIAVKPIAVMDGKLYWNYYVTDLTTGETDKEVLFRLKKSQPQRMHDGRIYCLGANGEIGYVVPTGGTEVYQPLTEALGTKDTDWDVKFFDDCIIALQRTAEETGFDVYRIAYEDGSSTHLGTVDGENVKILNPDGDTLYLTTTQETIYYRLVSMDLQSGETQTVLDDNTLISGMEIQVCQGVCYYAWRIELDVMEFGIYDLETGVNTVYRPEDSIEVS